MRCVMCKEDGLHSQWWCQSLLQELLNLVCVCFDLVVVDDKGKLRAWSQSLEHISGPAT